MDNGQSMIYSFQTTLASIYQYGTTPDFLDDFDCLHRFEAEQAKKLFVTLQISANAHK